MLFGLAAAVLAGQQAKTPPFPLTVESIMRGYALVGHAPRGLRWSPDGSELTFSWAKTDGSPDPAYRNYVVRRDGTGLRLGDGSGWQAPSAPSSASQPKPAWEASITDGDLYLRSADGEAKRLTTGAGLSGSPKISTDGTYVAYLKNGALFRLEVSTGKVSSLAAAEELASPPRPAAGSETPSQKALAKAAGELFKYFPNTSREPEPTSSPGSRGSFDSGSGPSSLSMAPSGDLAMFYVTKPAAPGRGTVVPAFVTRSGYTETIRAYPKVGEPESSNRLVLVNIRTGRKYEISTPRPGRVGGLRWSPDGTRAVTWATSNDNKDAWLYAVDPKRDIVTMLWNEHDEAWIGGPSRGVLGWLPDSSKVYFGSENTGYSNLYTVDLDGANAKNLTPGPYEASRISLDEPNRRFVFVSSEGSPFRRHIDVMGLDGSGKTKLADLTADEDASFAIAPDGKTVAVVKSKPNHPSELFIGDVQVTETPTAEWSSHPWTMPETVMIPARDGAQVPGRLYRPKRWRRGGPAVVFVHGAGYLQNIYDGWSHYYREYMFHNLLAERGYMVLDMDYRASAGYGKAWRTAIYRHMGGTDLNDQVDGAKWLVEKHGVAKDRLGIYGGSYGGFITLMAMFTTPDVFAAGAALRPVTDWANYNHGYTSNILNLPQDDVEAYRLSSPIFHAEGLKGSLLICHGMVDTNVHYQDTVRLAERLIELRKTNWEVAGYPIEDHDFKRPESWTDEYTRILNLFERTIGPNRIKPRR